MRDAQWSPQSNHYVEVVYERTGSCIERGDSLTMLRARIGDVVRVGGKRLRVVCVDRIKERSSVGAVVYVIPC
jgi:hypothetical protein